MILNVYRLQMCGRVGWPYM